jgi:manganese oxidase
VSNEAQGHPAEAGVAAKGESVSEHPPTLTGEAANGRPVDRQDNPYSAMLVVLAGGLAMAMIIFAVGFTVNRDGATVGASDGPAAAVPVSLSEFAISGPLEVAPGGSLAVTNDGAQVHNLVVEGAGGRTSDLAAGESETLELDLAEGQYELFCDIVGHRESGMETTLTVAAGASGEATAGGGSEGHEGHSGMGYAEMDQMMEDSFAPFVDMVTSGEPNTEGLGGQDLEPTMSADGYKEWTLTAEIIDWEIAPGETVEAWAYNGTVPGPTLRGEVGDKIRVKLINELPMGTDIHMHGMILPNSMDGVAPLTQELVAPGEEFVYEYEVTEPAVAMYHPHHGGQMQVPNGMWGAMIFSPAGGGGSADYTIPRGRTISGVEIPADLEVAQEQNMVLNDSGAIGMSLNGKSFPATQPYAMAQGDWMLVNYYNEGATYHPMHLHQFPQLVVARDGIPLDEPYFADTVTVGPGERYTVLFNATQPGVWVWHCHILSHAERETGMFGMVTAVKVD